MVRLRTQHYSDGVQSVSSGDTMSYEVGDDYRRLVGFSFVGSVERDVRVEDENGNRFQPFQGTLTGEGDEPVEIELSKGDTVEIEYQGSATVSDIFRFRTDRPIEYRLEALISTNEV